MIVVFLQIAIISNGQKASQVICVRIDELPEDVRVFLLLQALKHV